MITLIRQPQPPGKGLAVSALIHIAAVTLLAYFGGAILAPPAHRTGATLIFIPAPVPDASKPEPLPKPKLRAFQLPKLALPEPVRLAAKPALIDAPVIQSTPTPAPRSVPAIQAPPPPPQIRTGVLDSPRQQVAAQQTRPAPAVQLGGFSHTPNSRSEPDRATHLTAQPAGFDTNAQLRNEPKKNAVLVANTCAFGGGGPQPNPSQPKHFASIGGFGGTSTVASASASSRPAVVSAGGFGSASAGGTGTPRTEQQTARSGFGDTVAAQGPTPGIRPPAPPPSDSTPVEITSKPRPAYTDEARRLQIEGEVVIQAVFTASGEVQILRIIRGLGHGLNESALAAARSIRFRPATQHGRPVDSTATVRMSFELAY